jgi:hypothetical protein
MAGAIPASTLPTAPTLPAPPPLVRQTSCPDPPPPPASPGLCAQLNAGLRPPARVIPFDELRRQRSRARRARSRRCGGAPGRGPAGGARWTWRCCTLGPVTSPCCGRSCASACASPTTPVGRARAMLRTEKRPRNVAHGEVRARAHCAGGGLLLPSGCVRTKGCRVRCCARRVRCCVVRLLPRVPFRSRR